MNYYDFNRIILRFLLCNGQAVRFSRRNRRYLAEDERQTGGSHRQQQGYRLRHRESPLRAFRRRRVPDGPRRRPRRGRGPAAERAGSGAQVPSAGRHGRREHSGVQGLRREKLCRRRRAGQQRRDRVQEVVRRAVLRAGRGNRARQLFRGEERVRRAVPVAVARRPRGQPVQLSRPSVDDTRRRAETEVLVAGTDRRRAGRSATAVRGPGQSRGSRDGRMAVQRLRRFQSGGDRALDDSTEAV